MQCHVRYNYSLLGAFPFKLDQSKFSFDPLNRKKYKVQVKHINASPAASTPKLAFEFPPPQPGLEGFRKVLCKQDMLIILAKGILILSEQYLIS